MSVTERHLYSVFQKPEVLDRFLTGYYINNLLNLLSIDVKKYVQALTELDVSRVPIFWFDTHYGQTYSSTWDQASLSRSLPRPEGVYLPGLVKITGLRKANLTHWVYDVALQDFLVYSRETQQMLVEAALATHLNNICDSVLYVDNTIAVGVVYWNNKTNTTGKNAFVHITKGVVNNHIVSGVDIEDIFKSDSIPENCKISLRAMGWEGAFPVNDPWLKSIISSSASSFLPKDQP